MRRVLEYLKEMPTLAIATVVVGLVATAGAHVIENLDLAESLDEYIEWEETGPIPDSSEAKLGRRGEIQITDATLAATRANASDYRVYRVAATLEVDDRGAGAAREPHLHDRGAPERDLCPHPAAAARSSRSRARTSRCRTCPTSRASSSTPRAPTSSGSRSRT